MVVELGVLDQELRSLVVLVNFTLLVHSAIEVLSLVAMHIGAPATTPRKRATQTVGAVSSGVGGGGQWAVGSVGRRVSNNCSV
jgi:hypothetical protein